MAAPAYDKLIDAAMNLFYDNGFHAVGIDRIIDDAGVTKTTFYNHFESKDALILEVLKRRDEIELEEWSKRMREQGGADPRAQILVLFDILDDWFREDGFRGCLFINAAVEFPAPNDPIHITAASHGARLYERIVMLTREAGAPDPAFLTGQIMLLVAGAIVARHVDHDASAAHTARATAEILLEHQLGPIAQPVA